MVNKDVQCNFGFILKFLEAGPRSVFGFSDLFLNEIAKYNTLTLGLHCSNINQKRG